MQHHKPAGRAGPRLQVAQWRAASDAIVRVDGVARAAELAAQALQALRDLRAGPGCLRRLGHHLPDAVCNLQVLNVLRDVIQPPQQVPGIHQRRNDRLAHIGGHPQPGLLPNADHDPVVDLLNIDGQRRLSAAGSAGARGDLYVQGIAVANLLRAQIAAVEMGHQGLGNIVRAKGSVKNSLFHGFDYNHLRLN